jgi:hypothetical protein
VVATAATLVVLVAAAVSAEPVHAATKAPRGGDVTARTTYSIWGRAVVPRTPADPETARVTVGVEFSSSVSGRVEGVRFYKSPRNTGLHVGRLWTVGGRLLATVKFAHVSAKGWQTARFGRPVPVRAGKRYVASYTSPHGRYSGDTGSLSPSKPKVSRALTARRGVYTHGESVPNRTWRDSNYFVDVIFSTLHRGQPTGTGSAATAPAPGATTPAPTTPVPAATPSGTKPGPASTGVPAGTALTPVSGGLRITTANTVVNALDVSGPVVVDASNVTIRNSKIHGDTSDWFGVNVVSGSVTIEDSEIWGFHNGISFDNWKATRVNVHGMTDDGVKLGSNVTLSDSWIHDMTPEAGAHADGGQIQSGVSNVVVRHNVIDMASAGDAANAALFLAPDQGPSTPGPVTIDGNWLDGGNFTLFCVDGNNGQYFIKNISIVSNRFGSNHNFGPSRVNVPITQRGNVLDQTGATLGL